MRRPPPTEKTLLDGPAGAIDALVDAPTDVRGIALVCHPHPLFGGANTNKVAHTIARALRDLGYVAVRPNFRGVGASAGRFDKGDGETDDMLAVVAWAQSRWGVLPLALGGFSFGGFVQMRVTARLVDSGGPPQRLVLVGMAVGAAVEGTRHYDTPALPKGVSALVIHGEKDETVAVENVLDWARPQDQPVIVIPGADHFFHGKLHVIRDLISGAWAPL